MASINMKQIINELNTSSRKQLEGLAYGAAISKFENAKEDLLEEFENHDVTKELLAGPTAESKYLSKGIYLPR